MNTIEEALLKNRKVTEEINSIHEYLIYESLSNKFITEEDDNESYSVFGSIDEAKKYAKENNLKDFDIIEYNEEFEESAYKVVFTEGFDFEKDFLKIDESILEESTEKVVSKNWHDLLSELDRREVEYKNDLEPDQVFGKVCLETIEINNKPVFALFQDEDQFAIYCMKEKKEIKPFNAKEVVDRLVGEEVKEGLNKSLDEEVELEETYSEEELDKMIGKVYNQQKVQKIFRREKYGDSRLFAKTICTKCGRDKEVFLSNLINDPDKYGSCICSDENIDSTIEYAQDLYKGSKVLSNNTSGYTGVSFVKNYGGKPYNKWRAYIEIDGKRYYLGDFENKKDAVKARKVAGEKGVKWYKDNRNKLMRDVRKKTKKYSKSKYKDSKTKRSALTSKDLKDLKG